MSTLTLTSAAPDVGPHSGTKEEDLARDVDHGGVETVDDGQGDALTGVGSVVAEAGHLQCHGGKTVVWCGCGYVCGPGYVYGYW